MQWYKDPKTVSAYAGLIASVTAMIVSIAALRKKPDDTNVNNNINGMYKVLVEAVERLSDESEQNRADIYRIRKYLDDYVKDQNSSNPAPELSAPPHINPPSTIVQIEPLIPTGKGGGYINKDAGSVPIVIASANTNYEIKSRPPIKLDREWKAAK